MAGIEYQFPPSPLRSPTTYSTSPVHGFALQCFVEYHTLTKYVHTYRGTEARICTLMHRLKDGDRVSPHPCRELSYSVAFRGVAGYANQSRVSLSAISMLRHREMPWHLVLRPGSSVRRLVVASRAPLNGILGFIEYKQKLAKTCLGDCVLQRQASFTPWHLRFRL